VSLSSVDYWLCSRFMKHLFGGLPEEEFKPKPRLRGILKDQSCSDAATGVVLKKYADLAWSRTCRGFEDDLPE
jgi:hypothetical protein